MHLMITSTAFGLGRDAKSSLIAYDIDTFRSAVKDAFQSMQGDDVGMVTSMEIVPWIDNVEFQREIKLYTEKPNPVAGEPPISPSLWQKI